MTTKIQGAIMFLGWCVPLGLVIRYNYEVRELADKMGELIP